MPDFEPMRTGQLIVRQQPSWRRKALLVGAGIAAVLLLYIVYEWGRFEGGYSKFAEVQRRRELTTQIQTVEQENERLRAEIAQTKLARDVDDKAYADVEKDLAQLQAQILKQQEELTFYRGIVSPQDGMGGLRVQRFDVLGGGADRHYRLRLVLVQSMREDAVVSGSVGIEIEGTRENRPERLALNQAGAQTRADGQVPFRFRYFQELEQDIVLPEGFEPRAVNVEVRSSRLQPVRESYAWQVLAEG